MPNYNLRSVLVLTVPSITALLGLIWFFGRRKKKIGGTTEKSQGVSALETKAVTETASQLGKESTDSAVELCGGGELKLEAGSPGNLEYGRGDAECCVPTQDKLGQLPVSTATGEGESVEEGSTVGSPVSPSVIYSQIQNRDPQSPDLTGHGDASHSSSPGVPLESTEVPLKSSVTPVKSPDILHLQTGKFGEPVFRHGDGASSDKAGKCDDGDAGLSKKISTSDVEVRGAENTNLEPPVSRVDRSHSDHAVTQQTTPLPRQTVSATQQSCEQGKKMAVEETFSSSSASVSLSAAKPTPHSVTTGQLETPSQITSMPDTGTTPALNDDIPTHMSPPAGSTPVTAGSDSEGEDDVCSPRMDPEMEQDGDQDASGSSSKESCSSSDHSLFNTTVIEVPYSPLLTSNILSSQAGDEAQEPADRPVVSSDVIVNTQTTAPQQLSSPLLTSEVRVSTRAQDEAEGAYGNSAAAEKVVENSRDAEKRLVDSQTYAGSSTEDKLESSSEQVLVTSSQSGVEQAVVSLASTDSSVDNVMPQHPQQAVNGDWVSQASDGIALQTDGSENNVEQSVAETSSVTSSETLVVSNSDVNTTATETVEQHSSPSRGSHRQEHSPRSKQKGSHKKADNREKGRGSGDVKDKHKGGGSDKHSDKSRAHGDSVAGTSTKAKTYKYDDKWSKPKTDDKWSKPKTEEHKSQKDIEADKVTEQEGQAQAEAACLQSVVENGRAADAGSPGFDTHSEESNDSGRGGSVGENLLALSTGELVQYEFNFPSDLCGRLIGRGGRNIHYIKEKSGATVALASNPFTPDYQICRVQGVQAEVDKALMMIRKKFPISQYPQLDMTPLGPPQPTPIIIPEIMQLNLPEGVSVEVVVSAIVNAGHIFVQQPTHPSFPSLERLLQFMNACYIDQNVPELPRPVEGGVICAAEYEGQWYRAQVVQVYDKEEMCDIKYVDYGGYGSVPIATLRQIRSDFMTLPFQAVECYLANVTPLQDEDYFSDKAAEQLSELTAGKVLQGQVILRGEDNIPYIHLYQVSGHSVLLINRELVNREVVRWIEIL